MSPVLAALAASATTLAATNVDDIFLLTLVFARRVSTRRIVAGQYLGFAAIVTVSLLRRGRWGLPRGPGAAPSARTVTSRDQTLTVDGSR